MPPEDNIDRGDDFAATGPDAAVEEKLTPSAEDIAAADALTAEKEAKAVAAEAKTDAEPEAKPEAAKVKDSRIPAARHKEILDRERERREAVETELAQYKQGGKIADLGVEITAAETGLVALEAEYAKHLTDGDAAKAAEVMTKIRRTERAINDKTNTANLQAAEARAVERVRYDTTVERLEEQFPQLNVDHADFDKNKTAEVLELKEAFQTKGYTPSAALQKAVKLIMPPETKKQEAALEVTPQVDAKAVEAARKAAAVGKVVEAVGKTPASANGAGKDSDMAGGGAVSAKDILKMPYADFIKVDETTLARARGDVI